MGSLAIQQKHGIQLFNTQSYQFIKNETNAKLSNKDIKGLFYSRDGKYFCWYDAEHVFICDTNDFSQHKWSEKIAYVKQVWISPLSTYVVIWCEYHPINFNRNLLIYDLSSKQIVQSFSSTKLELSEIQWTADEKLFVKIMSNHHGMLGFYPNPLTSNNDKQLIMNNNNFSDQNKMADDLIGDTPICKTPSTLTVHKFSVSPRVNQTYIATFTRSEKNEPAWIRILQYPDLIPNQFPAKSLIDGDDCTFYWSDSGQYVLALVTCTVDKTNQSYYGRQALFLLGAFASRRKESGIAIAFPHLTNPIYGLGWKPNLTDIYVQHEQINRSCKRKENTCNSEVNSVISSLCTGGDNVATCALSGMELFCVTYGKMPSKTQLLNASADGDLVFDFGDESRNGIYFNPQGTIVALTGSGNIQGMVEFWDLKTYPPITNSGKDTLVSNNQTTVKPKEKGGAKISPKKSGVNAQPKLLNCVLINKITFNKMVPTFFEWCADGERIVIATTSPRMRVDNCFAIYHYTGTLLYHSIAINESIINPSINNSISILNSIFPNNDNTKVHENETNNIHINADIAKPSPDEIFQICQKFPLTPLPPKPITYQKYVAVNGPVIDKSVQQTMHTEGLEKPKAYIPPSMRRKQELMSANTNNVSSNTKSSIGKKGMLKSNIVANNSKVPGTFNAKTATNPPKNLLNDNKMVNGITAVEDESSRVKRVRNIKKRLKQIEELRLELKTGKTLPKSQMEKIESENKLIEELKALDIANND